MSRAPDDVDTLRALLSDSERIMVFTGAGVSVDSGIPDFRSPGGVWTRVDPLAVSRQTFDAGRRGRARFWAATRKLLGGLINAEPNPSHHAVVELERRGRVTAIVTQNVDGLHQAAGSRPQRVIELHGTGRTCSCTGCGAAYSMVDVERWIDEGQDAPDCPVCAAPVRPDVVAFGDPMPEVALRRSWAVAGCCDLCLVLGSSLTVYPAADIPRAARKAGARLAIVTKGDTSLDELADVRLRGGLVDDFVPAVFD